MSLHKIRRKDGGVRWIARARLKGRGSKNIARSFDKKIDAEQFLNEFKHRKRKQRKDGMGVQDFEDTTFAKEVDFWLLHNKNKQSSSHIKRMEGVFREILPAFGKLRPNQITSERLTEYQSELVNNGLAANTVNRKTEAFTTVFNFSVKNKRIPFNPTIGFSKLKIRESEKMNYWERGEAQNFLDFADRKYAEGSKQRWIYLVYKTALNTGLRAGEIWGLQPRDFVQNGALIFLRRQFNLVSKCFSDLKGGRSRKVPCNLGLRNELFSWIRKNEISLRKTVFFNEEGNPVDHNNFVSRFFERDLKESGVRNIRFHDMRHTAGTLMVESEIPITTVKEILGHRDLKTTMIYVHLLGSQIMKVADTFSIENEKGAEEFKLYSINK